MNQFDVLQGFLERAATDSLPPDRLAGEFIKVTESLGFRYVACCSHVDPFHPPREAVMLHNYPQGWVRTFSEAKLYEIDPVLERARTNPFPFFWDRAFQADSLTRSQKVVLADAASYGLTHGYTVPLHLSWLPGTLRASCSVVPDSEHIDTASYVAIELLAKYFYLLVSRPHAPWLAPPRDKLTQREHECMALVARGKHDWIIGRLLDLGVPTVHTHIEHGKARLGATTRPQAVALALMTGQLTYGELARRVDVDPARLDDTPRTGRR